MKSESHEPKWEEGSLERLSCGLQVESGDACAPELSRAVAEASAALSRVEESEAMLRVAAQVVTRLGELAHVAASGPAPARRTSMARELRLLGRALDRVRDSRLPDLAGWLEMLGRAELDTAEEARRTAELAARALQVVRRNGEWLGSLHRHLDATLGNLGAARDAGGHGVARIAASRVRRPSGTALTLLRDGTDAREAMP